MLALVSLSLTVCGLIFIFDMLWLIQEADDTDEKVIGWVIAVSMALTITTLSLELGLKF